MKLSHYRMYCRLSLTILASLFAMLAESFQMLQSDATVYRIASRRQIRAMPLQHLPTTIARRSMSTGLLAKKKKIFTNRDSFASSLGFGGAAVVPCDCGSGAAYNKCCGLLHQDKVAFSSASPEEVVRARYTAYARRDVDFIVASTHPLNKNFETDIKDWKKNLERNGYNSFVLNKCEILENAAKENSTAFDSSIASVRFLAHLTSRDAGVKTAFIETSTFERDPSSGAWLYRDGLIEPVEGDGV